MPRNLHRYKVRAHIDIDAPCDRLYRLATDPAVIPSFSREVASMELLDPPGRTRRARCRIRVARLPIPATYLYRYTAPRAYAGMQTRSPLARSYFAFSFRPLSATATRVTHIEGFHAPIPLLAWLLGLLYFHLLNPRGLRTELHRLKALAEGPTPANEAGRTALV